MSVFTCPFCGALASTNMMSERTRNFNFEDGNINLSTMPGPYLAVKIFRCPNTRCKKETIYATGVGGYIDNATVFIHPRTFHRQFPEYIPLAIRSDYQEASAIVDQSPKAAATLARRCLQGMIHDFWGIHEKNLNAEITRLKDKVSASQWKAIDAIRSIGNIGAHMEHDVNLIIDVDPDEARKLIRLIEHLIEKWYIDRHDAEELYAELATIGQEKSAIRKR